ncbi:MAG: triose-phosphate isomerase [Bacteroides sp.]|jgi:triosephosphate isomerase|nr:triose-phosphate isomerase [Bacteroides sp.]
MRKKIVAGNWKMNLDLEGGRTLAKEICEKISEKPLDDLSGQPEVLFFPPFVFLTEVVKASAGTSGVSVGSQNIHFLEKGAYTGEVAASMVKSCGATHTLIGHSERRAYFHEDNELLAKKVEQALKHDLIPVYCCGEVLPDREAEKHFDVVKEQIVNGLFWLDQKTFEKVVIAYEPVWAIGTGVTASPEQAQEMHAFIRKTLAKKYGPGTADKISILYGGSCNAQNANELFSQPDVDGGLIGGASLKANDFVAIISSF